ncbi:ABC transporter permease [Saccharopolyspora sp. NPDC000359]|uniref:ABC transporter permease n=1 Tax=Saccharopolyspora sp. NPDC000359 TaxID=3154251 RepID=UPI0033254EF2
MGAPVGGPPPRRPAMPPGRPAPSRPGPPPPPRTGPPPANAQPPRRRPEPRRAAPEPPPPPEKPSRMRAVSGRVGPRAALRHTGAIARRNLLQVVHDRGAILDATLMPMIFTLIFVYVFGGAIADDQGDYKQYLLPGIMVQTVSFASRLTGVTLNVDASRGVMDRLRALPIARSAVLSARISADMCRMLLGQLVMFVFALIIGFRVQTDVLSALAAIGVLLAYGFALCWISAFIGLALKSPETVQSVGFIWTIPLQFGSSMFVPLETMPGWLRAFAQVNPTTLVTDACRNLLLGGPVAPSALGAFLWIGGILLVFAPLSVWKYRRYT